MALKLASTSSLSDTLDLLKEHGPTKVKCGLIAGLYIGGRLSYPYRHQFRRSLFQSKGAFNLHILYILNKGPHGCAVAASGVKERAYFKRGGDLCMTSNIMRFQRLPYSKRNPQISEIPAFNSQRYRRSIYKRVAALQS